jgi:PAS domain S-box-containing protein
VVLTWNASAERIYGYTAAEAIGQRMDFLLPPDRLDEEQQILEQMKQGITVEHFETSRRLKDGTQVAVSLTLSPIRDETGAIIGVSHIARDITERKRAETRLRQSESKLRAFLESASQGIVAVDQRGQIELVNAKAEEMFGYSRTELMGRQLEVLIPAAYQDIHIKHRADYLAHPRPRAMGAGLDLTALRKDGAELPVEIALSFVSGEQGPLAIAFINDISERKQVEAQLRQTQKLESLGVLAGGVAHDFNNLLTGILGNSSLAIETLSTSHPACELIRNVVSASERAADLTKQLLAYAGKGRFVVEPINLAVLIREIGELIQTSIPRTVQLQMEVQQDLPLIEGDAGQLQQLIMNLVINGAEAIGEGMGGTVLVTNGVQEIDEAYILTTLGPKEDLRPGTYVTLEVHDTGCGMDEATLTRIFDPFFTTKFTGRGLGLAAARGIVRSHKGTLKVYSLPGRGSTFKLLFPALHEGRVKGGRQQPAAEILRGTGTILVIDDEPIVRATAKAMLERYGYTVLVAENGKEGVDLFRVIGDKIALVLLDMTMPVMSGDETLRHLQVVKPDVCVILSSGFNEMEAIRRFTGKGLTGFIQKPYSAIRLIKAVQMALDRPGAGAS